MDMPEICYATSGNVRIAYQVTGGGTLDLVFVPGFISNLEAWWEEPEWGHFRPAWRLSRALFCSTSAAQVFRMRLPVSQALKIVWTIFGQSCLCKGPIESERCGAFRIGRSK
jgi:hypothetical protein